MTSQRLRMRVGLRVARQLRQLEARLEALLHGLRLVVGDRREGARACRRYCFTSFRGACSSRSSFSWPLCFSWCPRLRASSHCRNGKLKCTQKRAGLVVGLRSGADDDVHAPDLLDLVVVDLREHDVLLDAQGVVAAAVERLRVQAAEVAHARQRDGHQAVEELVHARLAQRDLGADRHVLADLERRDRLAGLGDHRLLAGDQGEVGRGRRAPSSSRPSTSPTPMLRTIFSIVGTCMAFL